MRRLSAAGLCATFACAWLAMGCSAIPKASAMRAHDVPMGARHPGSVALELWTQHRPHGIRNTGRSGLALPLDGGPGARREHPHVEVDGTERCLATRMKEDRHLAARSGRQHILNAFGIAGEDEQLAVL